MQPLVRLLVVKCLHLTMFVMKRNLANTVNSYVTSINVSRAVRERSLDGGGGVYILIFMFCPRDLFSN